MNRLKRHPRHSREIEAYRAAVLATDEDTHTTLCIGIKSEYSYTIKRSHYIIKSRRRLSYRYEAWLRLRKADRSDSAHSAILFG